MKFLVAVILVFFLSGCTEVEMSPVEMLGKKTNKIYCTLDSFTIDSIEPVSKDEVEIKAKVIGLICEQGK